MEATIRCVCPPKADGTPRHDEDTVTFRESLGFREVLAIRKSVGFLDADTDPDLRTGEILALMTEGYILYGIESWTLVDEKGKPLPVSRGAIRERILAEFDVAEVLADAADDLYSAVVLLPLLARASSSSQPTPTADSTSPLTASPTKRPRPLRPSSTSTTPTDGTGPTGTSLDGDSSSSRSSASAA